MKKHKSVVAILLAVMMIFTMMPMMAFASDTPASDGSTAKWSEDYSKVTLNGKDYPTTKTWVGGKIHAVVDKSDYAGSAADAIPTADVWYYDLTGAKLLVKNNQATQYVRDDFNTVFESETDHTILLAVPAEFQTEVGAKTFPVAAEDFDGWDVAVKKPEGFKPDATTDQQFTVSAQFTTEATITGTSALPYLRGSVGSVQLTFLGKAKTAENAEFFYDEPSEDNAIVDGAKADYTGADHTVVMKPMDGYTVAYSVFNKNTGAYDSVSAVTVKNVADSVSVKAVVSNGQDKTKAANYKEFFFTVGVEAANAPFFHFDEDGDIDSYQYSVEGEEYDVYSYVVIEPASSWSSAGISRAKAAADKKALAANKDEIMAFFKEYYEITATAKKASPNTLTLKADEKDLTDAQLGELAKKYETLIANFDFGDFDPYFTGPNAKLFINFHRVGEIEFVNTPTVKTYKAKVLKKKAKSFKAKAVCDTGHEVSYKLINAPQKIVINKTTGKITLKKGLKKGTYKIKVKAYINNEYFETHNITIKVKK